MRIPDYCEALTAWRAWDAQPNGLLCGQAQTEAWPPYEVMRANCTVTSAPSAHLEDGRYLRAPIWKCGCGIHALRTEEQAKQRVLDLDRQSWMYFGSRPKVWGTVRIWGRVIEHELGFRAEFAYPGDLRTESEQLAPIVAQLYGVPCRVEQLSRPAPQQVYDEASAFSHISRSQHSFWRNQQIYPVSDPRCDATLKLPLPNGSTEEERCELKAQHAGDHHGHTHYWDSAYTKIRQRCVLSPPAVKMSLPPHVMTRWGRRIYDNARKSYDARHDLKQMVYLGFDPGEPWDLKNDLKP